jgi:calcineurin-like phosphoesterase family protein
MMRRTSLQLVRVLVALCLLAPLQVVCAPAGDEPPRFEVPAPQAGAALTFVVYGDTRFSKREDIVNSFARRALVHKITSENPAVILIGGDLVYEGTSADDYDTYKSETIEWSNRKTPVYPVLGNHEFRGCTDDVNPCLENWWNALSPY